jgi:hypothetical protein
MVAPSQTHAVDESQTCQQIAARFRQSGYLGLRHVLVEGRLPSRLVHWVSLQCCQRVAGVVKLIDRTEVTRPAESSVPSRKTPVSRPTGDTAD